MPSPWIPAGSLTSWGPDGLHVTHRRMVDAGDFTGGGGKVCWHTTEGQPIETMCNVLEAKRAAPHLVISRPAKGRPMEVVQCVPLDRAARALEHNGGPETNRANVIQVEIVEFARNAHGWDDDFLRGLAALTCLIEHHAPFEIPRKVPRTFSSDGTQARPPRRYTGTGWVNAAGHVGHEHAPNQLAGHWDPGRFNGRRMLRFAAEIDH